MSESDDLVHDFLVESHENLNKLDQDLVALEMAPQDRVRLDSVFRTIHTIKGTCGFFGFNKLGTVTHIGENLLVRLREGELQLDAEITSALLAMVDAVREILAQIESTNTEGNGDYQELVDILSRLAARPVLSFGATIVEPVLPILSATQEKEAQPEERPATNNLSSTSLSETNVRVDVGLLDKLMNLVGELVLVRNQILQFSTDQSDVAALGATQRLNLITSELQEGVMKTRMQPIGTVWNRFPRIVRDLATQCGKRVNVVMDGQETELDRTIIEAIKDPLTHVIRNAVDHGIESPKNRVAAGKSPVGRLHLRAFHEGGQVNIEVRDDGGGINPDRVKAKALARGLIDRDQALRLTDREIVQLVFLPGFSTAEEVTSVSGRGVGMDVVKTNIEKIGGVLDLQSELGVGTVLKMKIPLTLAIIPALIVVAAGNRFCIPQVNLLELVRLEGGKGIEQFHNTLVYRLRGRLLPLVDLNKRLRLPVGNREAVNIVVLQADGCQFGLLVDSVSDTEEIVVKPLGKQLKCLPLFAGATTMGDGKVALILDVLGLAHQASLAGERCDRRNSEATDPSAGVRTVRHLLLAQVGTRRCAIPLGLVARLEEVPINAIEDGGGREVFQYRDRIIPLVRMADFLGCRAISHDGPAEWLQVIVYTESDVAVGLVVDRILDVVESDAQFRQVHDRVGVEGVGTIHQRVTDVLNVRALVHAAVPDLFVEALP